MIFARNSRYHRLEIFSGYCYQLLSEGSPPATPRDVVMQECNAMEYKYFQVIGLEPGVKP